MEEIALGALLGTAVNELFRAVKDARRKFSSFEPILQRLESTLEAITPKLHEITLLNEKLHRSKHLHHHQSGIADLIVIARDGKELVAKCSKLSPVNYVKKAQYAKMLHDLDCRLLRYFDTVHQLDQSKDIKQILLRMDKHYPLDNDNDAKSRQIYDEIRSLSNHGGRGTENDITVKFEDQAEGSTSRERNYQGGLYAGCCLLVVVCCLLLAANVRVKNYTI